MIIQREFWMVKSEINAGQNEVIGYNIDYKIRKAVENAVKTVRICLHDAIFTAMNNVAILRVEMAVRSIPACLSGHGPKSADQIPGKRNFR